jgi:hypothetical protein
MVEIRKIPHQSNKSLVATAKVVNNFDKIQKKMKNVRNDLKGWGVNLRDADIQRKK